MIKTNKSPTLVYLEFPSNILFQFFFSLSSQNSRYFNCFFSLVILRMISIILLYRVFNYFCSSQKPSFPLFYYIKILITFFIKHFPLSQSFFSPILLVDIRASFQILHPPPWTKSHLSQIARPLLPLNQFFC